ncbi:hypothetical protein [Burkholderia sp. Ac-20344]|uniref:hypothetical protein n=1 Tax=Burkholderia sp. Ac-20344 TaxID=2703890 RepID=UPI001F122561|nr:hypothetical protein [Burkholderia sp. Ac-20344]
MRCNASLSLCLALALTLPRRSDLASLTLPILVLLVSQTLPMVGDAVFVTYPSRKHLDAKTRAWVDFMKAELCAALAGPRSGSHTDDDAAAPGTAGAATKPPLTRRPSPQAPRQKTSPAPLRPRAHTRD